MIRGICSPFVGLYWRVDDLCDWQDLVLDVRMRLCELKLCRSNLNYLPFSLDTKTDFKSSLFYLVFDLRDGVSLEVGWCQQGHAAKNVSLSEGTSLQYSHGLPEGDYLKVTD